MNNKRTTQPGFFNSQVRRIMFSSFLIVCVGGVLLQVSAVTSYPNDKLIHTDPITKDSAITFLQDITKYVTPDKIQVTGELKHSKPASIRVCPEYYNSMVKGLQVHNVVYTVSDDNSPVLTDDERNHSTAMQTSVPKLALDKYNDYDDIYKFCKALESREHSTGAVVTTEDIGTTVLGWPIILVKVTKGDKTRPAIWMDAGMHPREWISIATVMFMLNKLLTNAEESTKLLEAFDWYIVPVVNVDGYEFTRKNNEGRLWRKNRRQNLPWGVCQGVDLNRNFSFGYGTTDPNTSSHYCSPYYRGPHAFSEPETQAISQAILKRKEDIKMYLSFHSCGQLILIPWAYTSKKSEDYEDLKELAEVGNVAIEETYGTTYRVGTVADLIHESSGGSDDWAKGVAGIKSSYAFELRDNGQHSFLLPQEEIAPCGNETFNGIKAMAIQLSAKFLMQ